MPISKPNPKDLCLYLISEADRRDAKLDMVHLNRALWFLELLYDGKVSTSKHGIYSTDLIKCLTQLISEGLVKTRKSKDQTCFFLTAGGRKIASSEPQREFCITVFPDHYARHGAIVPNHQGSSEIHFLDPMAIMDNRLDVAMDYEFLGDLRRKEGRFDEATRLYSIALMSNAPLSRKISVCFDLFDIFHRTRKTSLSIKYSKKAVDLLEISIENKSTQKYSNVMQYILGFRSRFYKAVAGAWSRNKIDQKPFNQALSYYSKFCSEVKFNTLRRAAMQYARESTIFSSLLHDIGHCPYSPQWLSFENVDNLLNTRWLPESDEKYQFWPCLEFVSLTSFEVALCAYFAGDISEASKHLNLSRELTSYDKNNPIWKTTSLISSCLRRQDAKLDESLLDLFDSDLRRAILLMPIRILEEKTKSSLSKDYDMSPQESQEILDFLDSVAIEYSHSGKGLILNERSS